MKKLLLIILATLVLSGCGLDNKTIVEEIEFCKKAGLEPILYRIVNGYVAKVQCEPITNN